MPRVVIKEPKGTSCLPTTDGSRKFIAARMEMGVRVGGAVEFARLVAEPNWNRAHIFYIHAGNFLLNLASAGPESCYSRWMGFQLSVPGSLLAIGPTHHSLDVIYAFGHSYLGMIGAPLTATLVSELLAGDKTSIDITPITPTRFGSGKPKDPRSAKLVLH